MNQVYWPLYKDPILCATVNYIEATLSWLRVQLENS